MTYVQNMFINIRDTNVYQHVILHNVLIDICTVSYKNQILSYYMQNKELNKTLDEIDENKNSITFYRASFVFTFIFVKKLLKNQRKYSC